MKRFIILFAIAFAISLTYSNANADVRFMFFGNAYDDNMLHVDVFMSNFGPRLVLTERQQLEIRDILDDCHDRVIVYERVYPDDYDRLCAVRYADCDRRIMAVLTPIQLRKYRRWQPDVHRWIHEQRTFVQDEHRDARVVHANERRDMRQDVRHDVRQENRRDNRRDDEHGNHHGR